MDKDINVVIRFLKYRESVFDDNFNDCIALLERAKDNINSKNILSNKTLIELYKLAYNDGFNNMGNKLDIIEHRNNQIKKAISDD